ncbi:unnamed protein product [Ophioblennius macclurei]
MEGQPERSGFTTIHEFRRFQKTETTDRRQTERRLLRTAFVTLGVLCVLQAALNISLRLAFRSEEDVDCFPLNSSVLIDLCKEVRYQQNSSQQCSSHNRLLKILICRYQALEKERDFLREQVGLLNNQESWSGSGEEYYR